MNDDALEISLRSALAEAAPKAVPARLWEAAERIPGSHRRSRLPAWGRRRAVVLGLVVVVLIVGGGAGWRALQPPANTAGGVAVNGAVITLNDEAGVAVGLQPLAPSVEPFVGIRRMEGRQDEVAVGWTGNSCDQSTVVTLQDAGGTVIVSLHSQTTPLCVGTETLRAVVVQFRADTYDITMVDTPLPSGVRTQPSQVP